MTDAPGRAAPIDQLLERAIGALNRGDVTSARDLAEEVLATDASNRDAAALLDVENPSDGELRRLSLLFCDLVGSTELSARHEPELYRTLVKRYKAVCREVIEERYLGHISHFAGDGVLAVFGLPTPHENDAERAVRAAFDIVRELRVLSEEVEAAFAEHLDARAAVHKGLVFVDTEEDEVYGLAANVSARLQGLAAPGTVVVSEEVNEIVGALFETTAEPAQRVKGVDEPLRPFRVVAERPQVPARGHRWAAALVNRVDELRLLRERWRRVRDGRGNRPCGLHLVGEAGIGKSRLAAALADEARAESAGCAQLLGSPFRVDTNFHPVRTFIEGRCGIDREAAAGERLALLRREVSDVGLAPDELTPLLAPVLDIAPEAGYRAIEADSRKLREAIAVGAARYVLACLGSGPALMLVDDLHWCDESTLDLTARVLQSDRPDLLVITSSREAPPQVLGRIERISLAPLDDAAASELVSSLEPRLDGAARSAVVQRGDGVPLFLEELARGAGAPIDETASAAPSRPTTATSAAAGPSGSVPEVLYEPLVTRLYSTGSGVPVAAAVAAIGRDVDRRMLAQVVDMSDTDLDAALSALVRELILERALGDGELYRFRHELLRLVAYDLQPPSRRRELHRRVAKALIDESGAEGAVDWQLVAGHYDTAGQPAEAITAYMHAADGARRLGALSEARSLLGRAVELASSLPDSPGRRSLEVGVRLRRGFLAASAEGNSSSEAVQDYERCVELGLGDIAGDDMFSTLIPMFGYYMVRGDLDRAHQVAEMLRAGLASDREHYRPDNDAALGMIGWYAGDFGIAHDQLESSVAGLATRPTTPDYAATYFMPNDGPGSAHANLAIARFMRGDMRGADAQIDAARRRCNAIEFPQGPFTAGVAESYAVWTLIERGDMIGATAVVAALADLADRHGFDLWALIGATQQATIAALSVLDGEPDNHTVLAAHAEAVEGLCAMWKMLDLALFLPFYTTVAGRLRAAAGDAAGAAARYDETLQFARATGMHFYDAEVMRLQSHLLPDAEAKAQLRAAIDLSRIQGALPFELRIAYDLLARDDTDAVTSLAAAAARFPADAHYGELDDARSVLAAHG
ncbi:MAG: AAA family ATPase [Actinomycetota bacterium]|nr:AAA family ATPase [Actinomycetota bacterium]